MDLGFLDKVAAFLGPDSLLLVVTPCEAEGENEYAIRGFWAIDYLSSSSEDAEPESQTSGGSDYTKTADNKKRDPREEEAGDDRRKRYRVKVKNEREELKRVERELTLLVQDLIDTREGRKTSARTDLALSKNFWQDLASAQRELRLRSEAEQKRLVAAIQSQGIYIQNLRVVLPGDSAVVPSTFTNSYNQIGNYR
ncbi:uncharacterized protein IUM83_19449 [Phytophthora cinnamomi]|uniref:uncharacterized protein n=1 Tax=Phytophthora cinnamomi TaxID=4785 RepID=UPI0035593FE7|nr:hypothetical protein IUM83_19449 [Phytophthora cinnamomi]